jgi:spermidine/putrescine transport system permease protein
MAPLIKSFIRLDNSNQVVVAYQYFDDVKRWNADDRVGIWWYERGRGDGRQMKNGKLLVAPSVIWLCIFFVIPMLIVVAVSFASRTPYGQVVFNWTFATTERFAEALYISIFGQTLVVAFVTTVVTILMGYPLAWSIAKLPKKWQQPGLVVVMAPFWINFLIRSYAWVIILRSQGVVNTLLLKLGLITTPLQMLYNEGAVMLGMIYALLPFMVLPCLCFH